MYGKKRIAITKQGVIVLAGGKSLIPIGRFYNIEGILVGKLRKVENKYETKLDETNSMDFKYATISLLRKFATSVYSTELQK